MHINIICIICIIYLIYILRKKTGLCILIIGFFITYLKPVVTGFLKPGSNPSRELQDGFAGCSIPALTS